MTVEKLYHQDSYIREFSTSVTSAASLTNGNWAVTLSQTAFYPESGGQPYDTGFLNGIPVVKVVEENEDIVHIVPHWDGAEQVKGTIDWKRRFDHMQQHSGQHILSAAFDDLLQAETIGFHIGSDASQIDLALDHLTEEQVNAVETAANRIVYENRPIISHLATADTLGSYPLRKQPVKHFACIRLIDVAQFDCCPCGGTHPRAAGEIGIIKIRYWERKNNAIRVDFVCGQRALADYQQKNQIMRELAGRFSSPVPELVTTVDRQLQKQQALEKEMALLKEELSRHQAAALYSQADRIRDTHIIMHTLVNVNPSDINQLARQLTGHAQTIALLAGIQQNKAHLVFACSPDISLHMGEQLKLTLAAMNGKGGGNARSAQGGGNAAMAEPALQQAKERIIASL